MDHGLLPVTGCLTMASTGRAISSPFICGRPCAPVKLGVRCFLVQKDLMLAGERWCKLQLSKKFTLLLIVAAGTRVPTIALPSPSQREVSGAVRSVRHSLLSHRQESLEQQKQRAQMQRHEQERREFESGMKERDAVLRTKIRQHDPRLWWAQIKEDLSRLQVIDRELTQATSCEGPVDLKLITKAVSEIRKRATRIKSNLALPKAERSAEPSQPMA